MTSITTNDVTTAPMSGSLTVGDRALVGNTSTVENVTLDMAWWVVVHVSTQPMMDLWCQKSFLYRFILKRETTP